MEKIFTPNRWFVLFCAAFILIFALLQYVSTTRLQLRAKLEGEKIFNWSWQDRNLVSAAKITEEKILKRNETSAEVEVVGQQVISPLDVQTSKMKESERGQVKARLILSLNACAKDCAAASSSTFAKRSR